MFIKLHYKTLIGESAMLVNMDKIINIIEQSDGRAYICVTDPDLEIVVEESLEEIEKLIKGIAQKI